MRFYGSVLVVLADTPAAHGFKSGVGRALRKCRQCMATGEDIQSKVYTFLYLSCDVCTYVSITTHESFKILSS